MELVQCDYTVLRGTSLAAQWLARLLHILEVPGSYLCPETGYQGFRGFLQSLQACRLGTLHWTWLPLPLTSFTEAIYIYIYSLNYLKRR